MNCRYGRPRMSPVRYQLTPLIHQVVSLTCGFCLITQRGGKSCLRCLGLNSSAMIWLLTRLRSVTGDSLLVRAGRGLVSTPRAAELHDRVHELTRDVWAVLRPQNTHVDALEVTFIIRASGAFLEFLPGPVVAAVTRAASCIRLRFAPTPDKDARPLRERLIDLETVLLGTSASEIPSCCSMISLSAWPGLDIRFWRAQELRPNDMTPPNMS
jgi:hypothetical protein